MPQALLIVCEGKTEEAYFNILLDIYRPPRFVKVEVVGQKGQHLSLRFDLSRWFSAYLQNFKRLGYKRSPAFYRQNRLIFSNK